MIAGFSRKRIVSGFVAGMFGLLVVLLGGWWFSISLGLIVHLALLEFFRMAEFTGIRPATKTTLVACQLLLLTTQLECSGFLSSDMAAAVLPLSGAAICCWLILQPVTGSIADIASSIFGLFYLGFLPSHWIKLRNLANFEPSLIKNSPHFSTETITLGMTITLATCLMIVACDIGAYFFGRIYGKHALSPISPSKTVEGAIGGVLSAIVIGMFYGYKYNSLYGLIFGGTIGLLISFCALVGDLTESMLKRDAGLKDSGNVLPGHGGILDRIDSYLFAPAIVYYSITLFAPVISKYYINFA